MAFAMGLNLSVARSGSSLNDVISLLLANEFNVPTALWFGFVLLLLCLVMSVILVYLDNRKCAQKTAEGFFVPQPQSGNIFFLEQKVVLFFFTTLTLFFFKEKGGFLFFFFRNAKHIYKNTKGERVNFDDIKEFDRRYWLLTISCLVVYGCVLPWNNIGSNFISKKYGYSDSKANSRLLVPYLISAALTPFIGYSVDRIGRRAELLLVSAISLGLAHILFAFTEVNPFVPLVILGIACMIFCFVLFYSIYASAIWPSISLVVNENKLGTAYGLVTAVQNSGLGLIPIIVGGLVGAYDGDNQKDKYIYAEMLFIGLALLGAVTGIVLIFVDYNGEKKLATPSMKKAVKQDTIKDRLLDEN
ncbi:transporter belonging to the MFS superfamily [Reticulomyxa filosa]|uniref:Lysosomal dipeptide transporter MFSD1 n=1 Tax=Reticulomyxa filosa TaxID=46433 RepID=X6N5Y2_RETFI|nr:transporter belonging to the MFS superfamily [Reticulomyxa filosa]|eukprot:ETO21391.1 transporter belonging to the MFS superfamily [Reticulomyxa filosa]